MDLAGRGRQTVHLGLSYHQPVVSTIFAAVYTHSALVYVLFQACLFMLPRYSPQVQDDVLLLRKQMATVVKAFFCHPSAS